VATLLSARSSAPPILLHLLPEVTLGLLKAIESRLERLVHFLDAAAIIGT
jgi:hypothetical protein